MKVRIIDDNVDVAELFQDLLKSVGLEAEITTSNFGVALSKGLWRDTDYAIVDLDLGDNNINGQEILAYLKKNFPLIIRIVLSAANDKTLTTIRRRHLADVALRKPISLSEIMDVLE